MWSHLCKSWITGLLPLFKMWEHFCLLTWRPSLNWNRKSLILISCSTVNATLYSFIFLILCLQELSMLLLKDLVHFSCCLIFHCIPQFIYPFSLQEYLSFFQFFIITKCNNILVQVLLGTYKIIYPGYTPTSECLNMHIFNIKSYCKTVLQITLPQAKH